MANDVALPNDILNNEMESQKFEKHSNHPLEYEFLRMMGVTNDNAKVQLGMKQNYYKLLTCQMIETLNWKNPRHRGSRVVYLLTHAQLVSQLICVQLVLLD